MKLRQISEDIDNSREPIRRAAEVLGELTQYLYNAGDSKELQALHKFLSKPSPRAWEQTKWIIDSLTKDVAKAETQKGTTNQELLDKMQSWVELGELTSPVVSASVYDIDQSDAKGTPARHTSLSAPLRDKLKLALGPQGYTSALSKIGDMRKPNVQKMLKNTARDGPGLAKAARKDLPGVKSPKKF